MLSIAADVTAAINAEIDKIEDWQRPGNRKGQYYIDIVADKVAVSMLSAANFSVLSEETGFVSGNNGYLAIVDPLDGSTNASKHLPWYAVSICFLRDLEIQVARVENLGSPTIFEAIRSGGATKNGNQITVDTSAEFDKAVVGISSLPSAPLGSWQFRCLGAAALDLCCIASRSLEAYVDYGNDTHGVWDYIAGIFIAQEAGAVVGEVWDRDLITTDYLARRAPIAACSQPIFDTLLSGRRDNSKRQSAVS